jgi:hypothetical protein
MLKITEHPEVPAMDPGIGRLGNLLTTSSGIWFGVVDAVAGHMVTPRAS